MQNRVSKPLKLGGTHNTRDLGGYKKNDGQITCEGQLLRSDGLQNLSDEDIERLYLYGVRVIIDMRSVGEISQSKCAMKDYKDVKYYHIPLLDHIHSESDGLDFPPSLSEMYIDLYENSKKNISEVLRVILNNPDSCVLYNCMAGKDRTGIISALMLMLSGVEDDDVIADYSATEDYLIDFIVNRKKFLSNHKINIPEYLFMAPANEMELTIKWLYENYNTIYEYLLSLGLSEQEIKTLKSKL